VVLVTVAAPLDIAHRWVGAGPPELVLVHGWAGSGAYFDEMVGELDLEHVRVTSLDLSGHGESAAWEADWSLERIDAEILSVLDAIGAERAVLLGFSMAGKFVQHVALRHPGRVAGLLLVAGTQASAIPLPAEILEDWYARAGDSEAMKELVRSFLTRPVDESALDRFARNAARIPEAALRGTMAATIGADFSSELSRLAVPTLVVAGRHDQLFPPELLRSTIASQIRGARMAVLECGHEIGLEQPRELAALVEAFLAGLGR
jgi:pimeloyl-ACP methyl ester carboxylesterase